MWIKGHRNWLHFVYLRVSLETARIRSDSQPHIMSTPKSKTNRQTEIARWACGSKVPHHVSLKRQGLVLMNSVHSTSSSLSDRISFVTPWVRGQDLPLVLQHHPHLDKYKWARPALFWTLGAVSAHGASLRRWKRGAVRSILEGTSGCASSLNARLPNRQSAPDISLELRSNAENTNRHRIGLRHRNQQVARN